VIGVNKDAQSRGGSRYMHETLRAGDTLTIGLPRNNFPLDEAAPLSVFIAGGIGITPLRSMIRRMQTLGKPWRLHYAARTRQSAAFVDALQALRDETGSEVHFSFDREPGGRMLDIPASSPACRASARLLLRAAADARRLRGRHQVAAARQVHVEYFAARESAATEGGFTVELARTGRSVSSSPGTRSSIASRRSASSRPTRAAKASAAPAKCGC
jgi:vanillate O-demethylase ferredoxin subunit